jgi:hypothetical protein
MEPTLPATELTAETIRRDGSRQQFALIRRGHDLESLDEIPRTA